MSKLLFQITQVSSTRLQYAISDASPKPSLKAPDSQFVIHNGKLYPVRPEVQ